MARQLGDRPELWRPWIGFVFRSSFVGNNLVGNGAKVSAGIILDSERVEPWGRRQRDPGCFRQRQPAERDEQLPGREHGGNRSVRRRADLENRWNRDRHGEIGYCKSSQVMHFFVNASLVSGIGDCFCSITTTRFQRVVFLFSLLLSRKCIISRDFLEGYLQFCNAPVSTW